jgi:hypothetical protein
MNLLEFIEEYPDEASCCAKFKEYRDHAGAVYPKYGNRAHYWKRDKDECKECRYKQSLRANTVMHKSKLPFRYWVFAMHLLTSTRKTFSTKELQCQLGYKRYHPVWHMMHNLREAMGKCDGEYVMADRIALAISNAKRQILNTFHDVKPEFLQMYLDEFCYKFNRRYLCEVFFNRLPVVCVSYKNEFRYIYRQSLK